MTTNIHNQDLKARLRLNDASFWPLLAERTREAASFADHLFLSSLRKKAHLRGLPGPPDPPERFRLALLGGYSLYPLSELVEHCLETEGVPVEVFSGEYDNFVSEIVDASSPLYAFRPQVVVVLPSPRLGHPSGLLTDSREVHEDEADRLVEHLLGLCHTAHDHAKCEVVLANFPLPSRHDLGAFRARTLGSTWGFRKRVNLELGLTAPPYVHVCDVEFLASRRGGLAAADDRAWFESKQPGSPDLLVDIGRELSHLIRALRRPAKKVLVLDLDNTLWGGVVAEEGLAGIELGDTSPRGEAFKAFQRAIKSLKERGVLLAVCSKNDYELAVEPFEAHPEMVLRMDDIAAFSANWEPKSDNLRRMAVELNLGLDSFVFMDDNAAEIEIVRQFAPEVTAIHLGPDPAEYVATLQDCRLFEPLAITVDDVRRTEQYHSEQERRELLSAVTDMGAYLASLEMQATVSDFTPLDAPRIAQLINKSNQFNLTTRRRTEGEVLGLMADPDHTCFTVRLEDRFGDHGLIAVAIGHRDGRAMTIDTWLMSCRVLERQVEQRVLNELVRRAARLGCTQLVGVYLPTARNGLVREHYTRLGFTSRSEAAERFEYALEIEGFEAASTHIRLKGSSHEPV